MPSCGVTAYGNRLYRNILLYPLYCVQHVFVTPFVTMRIVIPRMMKIVTAKVLRCQGTPLSECVVMAVL